MWNYMCIRWLINWSDLKYCFFNVKPNSLCKHIFEDSFGNLNMFTEFLNVCRVINQCTLFLSVIDLSWNVFQRKIHWCAVCSLICFMCHWSYAFDSVSKHDDILLPGRLPFYTLHNQGFPKLFYGRGPSLFITCKYFFALTTLTIIKHKSKCQPHVFGDICVKSK